MNKEKQIEEMAMCSHCKNSWNCNEREAHERLAQLGEVIGCTGYEYEKPKTTEDIEKEFMANRGYRKASEVAREIFEEIEKMLINEHIESFKALDDTWTHRFKESLFIELNKLKKKYTEGK